MKRKRIIFNVFAFLFAIFAISFTACKTEEDNLESMTLSEGCPTEFVIGCFDTTKYSFVLTYKDGKTKTIELTEDMISNSDMLKTYRDGNHTLTVTYLNMKYDLNVTAKRFEFANIKMDDVEYTYSGSSYKLEVAGALPEGTTIIYPNGNQFVEAGTYDVKATLVNDYYVTKTISAKLRIKPAIYDMSKIKFEDAIYEYDGTPKSISVTGDIPKGLKVTYSIGKTETNFMVEASETPYVVVAHFDAGSNYEPIDDMRALLTINKTSYDLSNVKFADATFTYDGKPHSIAIESNLPSGVTVSYEGNGKVEAGVYEVEAIFTGDVTNYYPIPSKKAKIIIDKADMTLDTVYMDNATFTYDKMPHFVDYYGELPNGVSAVRTAYYEIEEDGTVIGEVDTMTNVGLYQVCAYFVYTKDDRNNYNAIQPITVTAEVTKADIDFLSFSDKTFAYDGFAHSIFVDGDIPEGLDVTYSNNAQVEVGKYTVIATFSFEEGSLAKRNYNDVASLNAIMKIEKTKLGININDFTYEFAGIDKAYSLTVSNWEVGGETLGQMIIPVCGTTQLTDDIIYESLPNGVGIYFTTKVGGVETEFEEVIDPSTTFLNAVYYSSTLESANDFLEHYISNVTSATKKNVTIGGVNKEVYILGSKSVLFNVTKRTYVPTFKNVLSEYTGNNIDVVIDVENDLANNPSLAFALGYTSTGGIYTNNSNKEVGIYTGQVLIKLSKDALDYYYDFTEAYEFKYAIRNTYVDEENDGRIEYNPGFAEEVSVQYDEDIASYTLEEPTNVPDGMEILLSYSKELTKPGSTIVRVIVRFTNNKTTNISDGDLAKYYYRLPSNYTYNSDGSYSLVVSYTINKKVYTPTFNTVFEYDGTPKLPEAINLPTWITIAYENLEGNEVSLTENPIIVPNNNPYNLKALLTINSAAMKEYYTVAEEGIDVSLTITKGHFTDYKIVGEKVKYDGNYHTIQIKGLPDDITYTTTLGEGVIDVGVYEDVIVYFHNREDSYYYDLKPLKLTMTIENNYIEMGRLESYCRTTGTKDIKQFSTLKEVLSKYINLDGAVVEWKCDYYNGSTPYAASYTSRHGSSLTMDDFIFSESTNENDICVCEFTIRLKNGYVFYEDNSITEFSGNLNFSVSNAIKVSVDSFAAISNNNVVEVAQLSTLPDLISYYAPIELGNNYTISSWSVDYYDFVNPYPTDYVGAHVNNETNKVIFNENDFTFRINTWGDKYCLVNYTITPNDNYCFFVNDISYKTYSGTVKCLVNKNVKTVDDTFLIKALSSDGQEFDTRKYTYFEDYIGELIDLNYINFNTTVFNKNSDIVAVEENTNKHLFDYENATDYEDMKANISFELKSGYSFKNTTDNSHIYNNVELKFDNDVCIDIIGLFAALSGGKEFVFEQYTNPAASAVKSGALDIIFKNLERSYVVTYPDGTTLSGTNTVVSSLDKVTEGDEKATIEWTYKAHNGYYFRGNGGSTGLRTNTCVISFDFKVLPVTLIDTFDIQELADEIVEVDQYNDIGSTINPLLENIKNIAGDKLTISYEGAYYSGTEKLDNTANISGDGDNISTILSTPTTGNADYYILYLRLSLGNNLGYLFDNKEKECEFTIKYKVNALEAFEDAVFDDFMKNFTGGSGASDIKKATLIQTYIEQKITSKYSFNSNIQIVAFKDSAEPSNSIMSIDEPYRLTRTGYHTITLYIETKDGTCMLDSDGHAVTKFEKTFQIVVSMY